MLPSSGDSTEETDVEVNLFLYEADKQYKVRDFRLALQKMKDEKRSRSDLTIASPSPKK